MTDTKLRIEKATALLKKDHQNVKRLFRQYEAAGDDQESGQTEIFAEIKRQLTIHAEIEDAIFYSAIASLGERGDAETLIREAREEHQIQKTLLEELSALTAADPPFAAKMMVLRESVEHHIDWEQKVIFPFFRKLDPEEQDRVSGDLHSRKMDLLNREET